MNIFEIFNESFKNYFEAIEKDLKKLEGPEQKIRIFIGSTINTIYEEREFFRTYVEALSRNAADPEVEKMTTTFYDHFMEHLEKLLKDGVCAGIFVNFDTEKLARAIYFLSIGVIFTRYAMKIDFDLKQQNAFQIDRILESIKSR